MLKVMTEDDLIDNINTSPVYKIDIEDRLRSNMLMYTILESRTDGSSKYLVYRRPHKDSSFHGMWSVGIGGSMELYDIVSVRGEVDKYESLINSGIRELNEEVTLPNGQFYKPDVTLIGYIDGQLKAIVGHIRLQSHVLPTVNEPENEEIGWLTLPELLESMDHFEPWSQYVIEGLTYLTDHPSMEAVNRTTWRDIPGYKRYEVNAAGELRNKKTNRVSQGGNAGRYLKVSVYPDGAKEPQLEYLHILICKAFHGLPSDGQVVLHKNNIRTDVRATNLKWGTQSENIKQVYDDGLLK